MYVFRRSSHNPLISPLRDHSWEEVSSCNGSALVDNGVLHMVYRGMSVPDKLDAPKLNRSSIGYAKSFDGKHFEDRRQLLSPEADFEKYGCEDPRVTKFGDDYYIFYTALASYPFRPDGIRVAVAKTKDFRTIEERHLVTPFNAKAMALFPERVNGKCTVILSANTDSPPAKIAIAQFDEIEDVWDQEKWKSWYQNIDTHTLNLRRSDKDQVEVGAVPIKTHYGWLLIYAYIQNYFGAKPIFGIEAALLDLNDPRKIISRTKHPFIVPETIYEKYGLIPDVTFPTGAVIFEGNLDIYYGASDTTVCRSTVDFNNFIKTLVPERFFCDFLRSEKNPILSPNPKSPWENKNVFNPAAVDLDGKVHILYRAMGDDNTSVIGYANSEDGLSIDYRHPEPIYKPREVFEQKFGSPNGNSGCEDPRITRIGNDLHMCYTAYDGIHPPRVAVTKISVENFLDKKWNWSKPVLITPNQIDDKDACILPDTHKGQYMILHRVEDHICADLLPSLDIKEEGVKKCIEVMGPRKGMWDSLKVGIGAPPMATSAGWLLLYHGVSEDKIYRVGAVLLDKENPTSIIARSSDAIFEPEYDYETLGEVNNVVFPCGAVIRKDTVYMYYGGADTYVAVATLDLNDTLKALS